MPPRAAARARCGERAGSGNWRSAATRTSRCSTSTPSPFTPLNDLKRQLVYCEDGASVRMTLVAGRVVYESGRITRIDEAALRAEMRELMAAGRAQTERAASEACVSSLTTARCCCAPRRRTSA